MSCTEYVCGQYKIPVNILNGFIGAGTCDEATEYYSLLELKRICIWICAFLIGNRVFIFVWFHIRLFQHLKLHNDTWIEKFQAHFSISKLQYQMSDLNICDDHWITPSKLIKSYVDIGPSRWRQFTKIRTRCKWCKWCKNVQPWRMMMLGICRFEPPIPASLRSSLKHHRLSPINV